MAERKSGQKKRVSVVVIAILTVISVITIITDKTELFLCSLILGLPLVIQFVVGNPEVLVGKGTYKLWKVINSLAISGIVYALFVLTVEELVDGDFAALFIVFGFVCAIILLYYIWKATNKWENGYFDYVLLFSFLGVFMLFVARYVVRTILLKGTLEPTTIGELFYGATGFVVYGVSCMAMIVKEKEEEERIT